MYKILKNLIEMDDYSVQRLSKSSSVIEYIWYKLWGKTIQTLLPSEYTQVEYIESSGTQYIDTGVTGSSKWEFTTQYTQSTDTSQIILGCGVDAAQWIGQRNSKYAIGVASNFIFNIDSILKKTIIGDFKSEQCEVTIDNTTLNRTGTLGNKNFCLFATSGNEPFYSKAKLYKCKCYQNNKLVRDLVPAVKKSNGNQLFDYTRTDGIITNKYINQAGAIVSGANEYYISYPISVTPGETYTWRFNADSYNTTHTAPTVGFYDINDNLISVAQHATGIKYFNFTVPSNCAYIRCSVFTRDNAQQQAMLNKGSTPLRYEEYIPDEVGMYDLSATSENLFSATKENFVNGETVGTGKKVEFTLKPNTKYTLSSNEPNGSSSNSNIWFNGTSSGSNGVWNNQPRTATTDSNGKLYVIIRITELDRIFNSCWIMLNEGTEALPYEPYQKRFYTNDGTGEFTYGSVAPTPSAPVEVKGVGDRAKNLWDEVYPDISGTVRYRALNLGKGTYTLSSTVEISQGSAGTLFFLAGNVSSGASTATNAVYKDRPITVTSTDGYVTIAYRSYTTDTPVGKETMLNEGSTTLPYEPYGYKIPIVCDNEIKNIYLNEPLHKINDYTDILSYSEQGVVRKIKKYEFTGQETFNKADSTSETGTAVFSIRYDAIGMDDILNYDILMRDIPYPIFYSAHFKMKTNTGDNTPYTDIKNGEMGGNTVGTNTYNRYIIFASNQYTSADDFTTFLQQQYANGTPVTVWYVLATEETEQIKAPDILADTYTSITVDTEVQPSQVDFTTKGKKQN